MRWKSEDARPNYLALVSFPRTCTHTYARMHMHAHIRTYTHTHMHAYAHTHMHTHAHIHTCTCMHTHTHMHAHARTHMHAHTCTHTHTRTHTHMLQCPRVHLPSSRRREGKEARALLPRSADHLPSVTVAKGFDGPSHCRLVSLSPSALAPCAESPDPLQNDGLLCTFARAFTYSHLHERVFSLHLPLERRCSHLTFQEVSGSIS